MRPVHRPRSFSLLEELPGNSPDVIFRGPSRYARSAGAGYILLCLIWIAAAFLMIDPAARRTPVGSYIMAAVLSLPALIVIGVHLEMLWTRRSVIIHRREGILSDTTRTPFRSRTMEYRLGSVRAVHLTYWNDARTVWYVGIEVAGDERILMGTTRREADARHLGNRVAQVLGVPLKDQAARALAVPQ